MCFDDDARPPLPPVRGGATDHGDVVLTSADGTQFSAYYAHPESPSTVATATGIVILPDIRGLHGFYKDLARRLAQAGVHAVAFDFFGRTAGLGERGDDFSFREHVDQTTPEQITADTAAAADWLSTASTFTLGFCFGGAHSWRQSGAGLGLNGCIGFYGPPDRAADVIDRMTAPLLLLAAGQDHTPVADVEAFAARVRAKAGLEAEVHVYPDAPHSFFDRRFAEHQEACDDAWRRILDFIHRHATR